jgi:hypothetical protein
MCVTAYSGGCTGCTGCTGTGHGSRCPAPGARCRVCGGMPSGSQDAPTEGVR